LYPLNFKDKSGVPEHVLEMLKGGLLVPKKLKSCSEENFNLKSFMVGEIKELIEDNKSSSSPRSSENIIHNYSKSNGISSRVVAGVEILLWYL
jgi:hypothetical protein